MSVALGTFTLGEKPSPLTYQFLTGDVPSVPINLSAGYTATFVCQEHDSAPVSGLATVSDAVNGKVTHTWLGTEFLTAGSYTAYFWVGNGTNRYASVPITFTVQLPVGAIPGI